MNQAVPVAGQVSASKLQSKRSIKGPTGDGLLATFRPRMQVCTTSGVKSGGIEDDLSVDQHQPHEVSLGRNLTTSHAGTQGSTDISRHEWYSRQP